MKDTTKKWIEKNYGKLWLMATIIVLSAILIFGIWGFFGKQETTAKNSGVSPTPTKQTEQLPPKSPVVADKVPTALKDAGEFGENIYDAAKTGDWKTAKTKLDELKTATEKLTTEKIISPKFEDVFDKLEKAVEAKDKTASLVEANQLTLEAANLTAKYNPAVPIEITKLDFYGRELEIWSAAKNDTKLKETAKLIRQDWNVVKPKIEVKGGTKQASVFEKLVLQSDAAKTPAEFAKLATPILDEVDNLEKVFE